MLTDIYRVGIKKNGKTVYHHIGSMEALIVFLSRECSSAERVTIVRQTLFTLDDENTTTN